MLDIYRLVILREVKYRGSLNAAARALAYTPSAVSQQLSKLETEVGSQLLTPVGRGVQLTDAAELLVEKTESILEIMEQTESELAAQRGEPSGLVQIAAPHTVAVAYIPKIVQLLDERYPLLTVKFTQLEPGDSFDSLAGRRIDVAIADEYPGRPRKFEQTFHKTLMRTESMLPYRRKDVEISATTDLGNMDWILEPPGWDSTQWALRICREVGFEPNAKYSSPDLYLHKQFVLRGLALGFLPDTVIFASDREHLEVIDNFPTDLTRNLFAYVRKGGQRRPAIEVILNVTREVLSADDNLIANVD